MVLDALEGDLVTKSDFAVYQERLNLQFANIDHRFKDIDQRFDVIDHRFDAIEQRFVSLTGEIQSLMHSLTNEMQSQVKESEFRTLTKLGLLNVSSVSIAVAVLAWLIKI
jgi:DNA anti-recombination protein RmuC